MIMDATSKPERFVLFTPYPHEVGQKIRIGSGPRRGDWEVIGVTERKLKLRCPVTAREVEWDRFCYFVEEVAEGQWPLKD